ncbi:MAG: hypothetical protein ABSB40_01535 [Nitrososphaeria archaeon]
MFIVYGLRDSFLSNFLRPEVTGTQTSFAVTKVSMRKEKVETGFD